MLLLDFNVNWQHNTKEIHLLFVTKKYSIKEIRNGNHLVVAHVTSGSLVRYSVGFLRI